MTFTTRTRIGLATAVLATIAIGTGCSSSAKSGAAPTSPTSPMATATSRAPANAPAMGNTITIKNFAFGTPITVKPGATVTVVNDGDQTHTLSADDASSFDTGPIVGGKTATFVAPADPGVYKFHCNIHDMHGSLQVIA
jgi:plastocyanin